MNRLNLGCGGHYIEGDWINIDLDTSRKLDRVADVRCLPYDDNSVDEIYAGHVLEHFAACHAVGILREWRRVLKEGCKLTVVVPDIYVMAKKLVNKDISLGEFSWGCLGYDGEDASSLDKHECLYDKDKLHQFMKEAGFNNILMHVNIAKIEIAVSSADWQLGMEGIK